MRKLKRNDIKVRASDFPSLLYPNDGYDPNNVEAGLLRNPIALRVRHVISQYSVDLMFISKFFRSIFTSQARLDQPFLKMVGKPRQKVVRRNSTA
jgi:hypothetical protein